MNAWSHRAVAWLVTPIIVVALGGCSLLGIGGVVPAASMSLGISNQTTIPVVLSVNGTTIDTVHADTGENIPATRLPALPWVTEVQTVAGRVLLRLTVHEGDVSETHRSDGTGSSKGDGARVDLSCGRIDLWSGPPMLGPMPGPGTPGDCDP